MKIEIHVDAKLSKELKTKLYTHLKSKKMNGVESIDWITTAAKPGEMGNGAGIQAIGTLINNSQTGLVELFKTVQVWINLYKQEITIKTEKGLSFEIRTKQLDDKLISEIIDKIIANGQVVDKKTSKALPEKKEKPKTELPPALPMPENKVNTPDNTQAINKENKENKENKDIKENKEIAEEKKSKPGKK